VRVNFVMRLYKVVVGGCGGGGGVGGFVGSDSAVVASLIWGRCGFDGCGGFGWSVCNLMAGGVGSGGGGIVVVGGDGGGCSLRAGVSHGVPCEGVAS
jgi:hypothetical protein